MSSDRSGGKDRSGGSFQLFNPKLDVEMVFILQVDRCMDVGRAITSTGSTDTMRTIYVENVLNLDSFVFPLLTADEDIDWSSYIEEREKLVSDWPISVVDQESRCRKLFMLTIRLWRKQRLFKVRRYGYFGARWKKGLKVDLEEMRKAEEEEGTESQDEEGGDQ